LNNEGYNHLTVNHSLHFKDPETGIHSNTIESSWRHAKASMSQYCRKKEFYAGYLAKYMFIKRCRAFQLDPTEQFFKHVGILYDSNNEEHGYEVGDAANDDDDDDDDNNEDYI